MLIYWITFVGISILAINSRSEFSPDLNSKLERLSLDSAMIVLVVIVGMRYQVGVDWNTYNRHLHQFLPNSFLYSENAGPFNSEWDVGYSVLAWLGAQLGGNLILPHFICALILLFGLRRFCLTLPNPLLGLVVAIPYLIWVVGQGYTRQATAIGFFLIGLTFFFKKKPIEYVMTIAVGALFHKSVILTIPLALLLTTQKTKRQAIWEILLIFSVAFILFKNYGSVLTDYFHAYGVASKPHDYNLDSSGALVRTALTAMCCIGYIVLKSYFRLSRDEQRFWTGFSVFGILMFPAALFFTHLSTPIDRLGLYLMPIQIFFASHLPSIFSSNNGNSRKLVVISIVLFSALMQWIWLFYASHSYAWVPYRFYPWEILWRDDQDWI